MDEGEVLSSMDEHSLSPRGESLYLLLVLNLCQMEYMNVSSKHELKRIPNDGKSPCTE